jgi:hypothetical protein
MSAKSFALATGLLAALVTLIFGRWASISTPLGGLKAGAIIGLVLGKTA